MDIDESILCKQDFDNGHRVGYINKNKWYKAVSVSKYHNSTSNEVYDVVLVRGDNGAGEYFTLKNINGELYMWDYFYSAKDIRKMKLDKIGISL